MKPSTVQKLLENIPEVRELVAFLASEAEMENKLDGLDALPADERAIEATVRIRTHKRIVSMLAPLIGTQTLDGGGTDPSEYVV